MKLHHIGLVVPESVEVSEALARLGFRAATRQEPDPIQQVSARFVPIGQKQDVYIEILQPEHDTSPISNFLTGRCGGLHHICFQVEDIDAAAEKLIKSGAQMVCEPVDCVGYDRSFGLECRRATRIAFFLLAEVLLIELLEEGSGQQKVGFNASEGRCG
jgi:methylmalonyl-CoA/ethylmalonyl-CoA epimerase